MCVVLERFNDKNYALVCAILYSYKFSRDVYFADATNSVFLQSYFRGSQELVEDTDYVHTIIKYKLSRT